MSYSQRTSSFDGKRTNNFSSNNEQIYKNRIISKLENTPRAVESEAGEDNILKTNLRLPPVSRISIKQKQTNINQNSSSILLTSGSESQSQKRQSTSLTKEATQSNQKSSSRSGSISKLAAQHERKASISPYDGSESKHQTQNAGKMIDRYYEKYSQNLKMVLFENQKDIDLIGNERFKGHDAHFLLEEMNQHHIKNKFNEEYSKEKKEMEEIDKILSNPDCELTSEQREFLIRKRDAFEERIELTPLPVVHRKSFETSDIKKSEILNKAQRSAVIMRRYEYEMNFKRSKAKKNVPKVIPQEAKNSNQSLVEYLIFIRRITILQRVVRYFLLRKHVSIYFEILIKFFRIQRALKLFLIRLYHRNWMKKLTIESESLEIIRGFFNFLKVKFKLKEINNLLISESSLRTSYNSEFKQLTFRDFNNKKISKRRSRYVEFQEPAAARASSFSIFSKYKLSFVVLIQAFIRMYLLKLRFKRNFVKVKVKNFDYANRISLVRKKVYFRAYMLKCVLRIQRKIKVFLKRINMTRVRKVIFEGKRRSEQLDNFVRCKSVFINDRFAKRSGIKKVLISRNFVAINKIIFIQAVFRRLIILRKYNIKNINGVCLNKNNYLKSSGLKIRKIKLKAIAWENLLRIIMMQKALRCYSAKLKVLRLKSAEEIRKRNHFKAKLSNLKIEHCNQDLNFQKVLSKQYNKENFIKKQIRKLSYSKSIFIKIIKIQANVRSFLFRNLYAQAKEKMLLQKSVKIIRNLSSVSSIKKKFIPLSISRVIVLLQKNVRILLAKNLILKMKFEEERKKASLLSSKMKFFQVENCNQINFSNILNKKNFNLNSTCEFKKFCYSTGINKKIITLQSYIRSFLRRNFFVKFKENFKKKVSKANLNLKTFTARKKTVLNINKEKERIEKLQNITRVFLAKCKLKKLRLEDSLRNKNLLIAKLKNLKIENSDLLEFQNVLNKKNIDFVTYDFINFKNNNENNNNKAKIPNLLNEDYQEKCYYPIGNEFDQKEITYRALKSEYKKRSYSKSVFAKIKKLQAHFRRFLFKILFEKTREKYLTIKYNKINLIGKTYICTKKTIPYKQLNRIKLLQNILRMFLAKIKFIKLRDQEMLRHKNLLNSNMKNYQIVNSKIDFLHKLSKENFNLTSNSEYKKKAYSTRVIKNIIKIQTNTKRFLFGLLFSRSIKEKLISANLKNKFNFYPNIHNALLSINTYTKIKMKQRTFKKIILIQSYFRMYKTIERIYGLKNPLIKIPLIQIDINKLLVLNAKRNLLNKESNVLLTDSTNASTNNNSETIFFKRDSKSFSNSNSNSFNFEKFEKNQNYDFNNFQEKANKFGAKRPSATKEFDPRYANNLMKQINNKTYLFRKAVFKTAKIKNIIKIQSTVRMFLFGFKFKKMLKAIEEKKQKLFGLWNPKFEFMKLVMRKFPFREKQLDPNAVKQKKIFQQKLRTTKKINYKLLKIICIQKFVKMYLAYVRFHSYRKNPIKKAAIKTLVVRKFKKRSMNVFQLIRLQIGLKRFLLKIKKKKNLEKLIAKDKIRNYLMKKNFIRWHRKILKIKVKIKLQT